MEKSYKLIKEYPNSPVLGTIAVKKRDGLYVKDVWYLGNEIENFPEFWEEIVDYEILEFKDVLGDVYRPDSLLKDTFCIKDGEIPFYELNTMLESDEFHIISVKRLSDGVIFSVGDKIECTSPIFNNEIITKFRLIGDVVCVNGDNFQTSLNYIHKIESLLTTADNVNLYHGDNYFYIDDNWSINQYTADVIQRWDLIEQLKHIIFSTKEAAQEYIIKNKPVLSYQMLEDWGLFELQFPLEEQSLIDFIKSKINNE